MGASQSLFSTVHQNDPLNFRVDNATNYQAVSDFLKFDKAELAKIAGVRETSIRFDNKIPADLRERLDQIANICSLVAEYFDGDSYKTALWFKTPNPMLGDVTPRDMIRLGRYKRLLKFINESRSAYASQTAETKAENANA
ncbi:MAG: DUF2384 domain-containing protein [Micavibrio aeruginosavorus]|uniref:DUF2384 domain-containing protein n=1 Tax=Micavibrio aeruginosavorus TaxID=349221 RepID=A0A7T5R367_9BACT|nr:MAG: DUF2384 domain-containing protein [Micavibrio aeruginosavorus]